LTNTARLFASYATTTTIWLNLPTNLPLQIQLVSKNNDRLREEALVLQQEKTTVVQGLTDQLGDITQQVAAAEQMVDVLLSSRDYQ
jgi:Mlc titration factor MtfA (ptsG expression regulator)